MGAACCSGDDGGEQIMSSEVKGCEDPEQEVDGMPSLPAAAAKATATKAAEATTPAPASQESSSARLTVEFLLPDGTKQTCTFTRRPLGLDFNKTNPILMKRVQQGTHGEELGIQPGWQVVGVNGEDVTTKEFDYTYNALRKISTQLPGP